MPQTIDMSGQVALVTGASRGIGAAVARAFSAAGAAVVLASRDGAALDHLAEELQAGGGEALAVPTDVTDQDAVAAMVAATVARFGRLDHACNDAGGSHRPTQLADLDVDAFDAAYAVNLRGAFLSMKYEIPALLASGGGAIVNISSTAGLDGVGGLSGYVSAKHGLEGLTKVAALDYGAQHVRVNCVAPGPILTEGLQRAGAKAQQIAADAMPLKRVGQPEEVAAAVVWLCSESAAFITGTTLVVDGGKLAGTPLFMVQQPT
ncbi:MAG: short-chain dehydrogenase/reductase [Actinomycetia bacterium]|nr:short-chain dehydrogenase/reductase [Actinomycetes bacterium]